MNLEDNIKLVKQGFESSFSEKSFYEKQTIDDNHLSLLINMINAKSGNTIVDLGTGTGYIAFPLAEKNVDSTIIGIDIVTETLKRNSKKAAQENLSNLSFISYDGKNFPFLDNSIDIIITRYALHHFPNIEHSFKEIYKKFIVKFIIPSNFTHYYQLLYYKF
jgi:ubiquinone/menaquinone biosynthesis C-methylase UbiE